MTPSILVLGHTGFIGRNLQQVLAERGLPFVGASRRTGVDLQEPGALRPLLRSHPPDVIINCVALVAGVRWISEHHAGVLQANARMLLNLYETVASESPGALVVNPIGNCVYPPIQTPLAEAEIDLGPPDESVLGFAASRRLLLYLSQAYRSQQQLRSLNVIVPNAYGMYDSADPEKTHALNGLVLRMLTAKRNGDPAFEVWGSGRPKREWIYARDFASILVDLALGPPPGVECLNIGCGKSISIGDLAHLIKEAMGYPGEIVFQAHGVDGAASKTMAVDQYERLYPGRTQTPLREGVQETIRYYSELLEGVASTRPRSKTV